MDIPLIDLILIWLTGTMPPPQDLEISKKHCWGQAS
jgi:hypothetical protein